MNLIVTILLWILIGAIIGWLAGIIMRSGGSFIRNAILGILGALLGGFIAHWCGIELDTWYWTLLAAIAGSCLLIFIFRLLFGKK